MIDHRACQIPGWGGVVERATYTCNHCHATVFKNQDRVRERGYCRKCDSVICDNCVAIMARTLECMTMDQIIDETLNAAVKRAGSEHSSILLR